MICERALSDQETIKRLTVYQVWVWTFLNGYENHKFWQNKSSAQFSRTWCNTWRSTEVTVDGVNKYVTSVRCLTWGSMAKSNKPNSPSWDHELKEWLQWIEQFPLEIDHKIELKLALRSTQLQQSREKPAAVEKIVMFYCLLQSFCVFLVSVRRIDGALPGVHHGLWLMPSPASDHRGWVAPGDEPSCLQTPDSRGHRQPGRRRWMCVWSGRESGLETLPLLQRGFSAVCPLCLTHKKLSEHTRNKALKPVKCRNTTICILWKL